MVPGARLAQNWSGGNGLNIFGRFGRQSGKQRFDSRQLGWGRAQRHPLGPYSYPRHRIATSKASLCPAELLTSPLIPYSAAAPRSWLRMRIASSTLERNILPSPILPVAAAARMA